MLSAPSSPVIWMVSGPVDVGDGVVVAAGVSMAGCSGSWFQTISISATSANKKNRYTVVTISCFFIGSLPPE
ncbi:Uncharacterised protein [Flavonifractor plautii]|uniref:Uncharacterized protein n=1 Tax=Flavonifractor plautii TaxID=292800 RepID=A0A174D9V9_FLAPL|nr:Uncharacterised protein [Flavonifractor plautii]